ncbi:MAG: 5'/3'-nucleotidase SurE [Candidatus Marinimicrobia bacterium]|nr:5'/3'-nucleotidase SurE [Candidatus Neomarinimicrobiota bacterium]
MSRPLILLSNDDGIQAAGLKALAEAMREVGEVVVIAPEVERSAMGHAITISDPLRVKEVDLGLDGVSAYACSGTPADCVKLGLLSMLSRKPDLVVSGINHGGNTGVSVIYSGTVSAAAEGTILGVPGLAVSVDAREVSSFEPTQAVAYHVARGVLDHGLPSGTLLNINVPALPVEQLPAGTMNGQGYVLTVHGKSDWQDHFDRRVDPNNRVYYWLSARKRVVSEVPETDEETLKAGRVSITPLHYNLTDYKARKTIASWDLFSKPK